MDTMGTNFGYLLVFLFNIFLFGGWVILAIVTLINLRRQTLSDTARATWAAVILLVPILGAVSFWIVKPGHRNL